MSYSVCAILHYGERMKDFTKRKQRHVRKAPSTSQKKRRKSFLYCCNFWSRTLADVDREEWSVKAPGKLTGFNYFLQINIIRDFNDIEVLTVPPE